MDLDNIHQKLLTRVVLKEPHPNYLMKYGVRNGVIFLVNVVIFWTLCDVSFISKNFAMAKITASSALLKHKKRPISL